MPKTCVFLLLSSLLSVYFFEISVDSVFVAIGIAMMINTMKTPRRINSHKRLIDGIDFGLFSLCIVPISHHSMSFVFGEIKCFLAEQEWIDHELTTKMEEDKN